MQTFLPIASFAGSAAVLDRQRLGKQRVENLQILTALFTGRGWVNHPCTKMWRGFEWALLQYQIHICEEWLRRGYQETCLKKSIDLFDEQAMLFNEVYPWWLEMEEFHLSHQSNLIRKDPEHYRSYFPDVPDDLPYYWPV